MMPSYKHGTLPDNLLSGHEAVLDQNSNPPAARLPRGRDQVRFQYRIVDSGTVSPEYFILSPCSTKFLVSPKDCKSTWSRLRLVTGRPPPHLIHRYPPHFNMYQAWWQSGLMRKTRNLVPSGASVRIRPTSTLFLASLPWCLLFVLTSDLHKLVLKKTTQCSSSQL